MPEEIEAKFYVTNLPGLRAKLMNLSASVKQKRVYEQNLRFDTPSMTLSTEKKVLRLRQDEKIRLTFKGPGYLQDAVLVRPEFEVEVSDFEQTRQILEGLGYQVYSLYEKYRETLCLDGVDVMLDEMPYGNFVELEGPSTQSVKALARKMGLDFDKRIVLSYMVLFDHFKTTKKLAVRDLTFDNFKDIAFSSADFENLPES
ncbi:MAG TPA: class IV adenylate cyclase [Anaerolineaceae bacterium]|nr:class IV adenylate cyclase [Anaerolineaceae bacterium]